MIEGGSGDILDRDLAIGLGHTNRHGGHPVAGPGVGEVVAGRQCLPMELVSGHDDNVVDQLLMLSVLISQGCYQASQMFPSENLVTKFIARLQDRALVTIFNNFI